MSAPVQSQFVQIPCWPSAEDASRGMPHTEIRSDQRLSSQVGMQEHLYASSVAQRWRSSLYAPNTGPSSSTRAFLMTGLSLHVTDTLP